MPERFIRGKGAGLASSVDGYDCLAMSEKIGVRVRLLVPNGNLKTLR
jgi:hypothetical protein